MERRSESCSSLGDGYQQRSHCWLRVEPRADFSSGAAEASESDSPSDIPQASNAVIVVEGHFMVCLCRQVSCQPSIN